VWKDFELFRLRSLVTQSSRGESYSDRPRHSRSTTRRSPSPPSSSSEVGSSAVGREAAADERESSSRRVRADRPYVSKSASTGERRKPRASRNRDDDNDDDETRNRRRRDGKLFVALRCGVRLFLPRTPLLSSAKVRRRTRSICLVANQAPRTRIRSS
jgi:hypothetical protein